jgi:hypothetical protein
MAKVLAAKAQGESVIVWNSTDQKAIHALSLLDINN